MFVPVVTVVWHTAKSSYTIFCYQVQVKVIIEKEIAKLVG